MDGGEGSLGCGTSWAGVTKQFVSEVGGTRREGFHWGQRQGVNSVRRFRLR